MNSQAPRPDAAHDERGARFDRFVARKTADANHAHIQPFVTDVDREPDAMKAIGNDWSRRLFDGNFYLTARADAVRPACSLVFVQSQDGNTGADDPSTLGGGENDKHLIYEGLSQVSADAVLSGAQTVRNSEILFGVWHPELVRLRESLGKPRYPIQIIATLRGLDLDACLLFNVPEVPVLVLTIESGLTAMKVELESRPWVRPIVMASPDLAVAFDALASLGIGRVSAVGGRHLAAQLIDAGLVQDVYLTTSAKPGGEPGTPMYPARLRAHSVLVKHGTAQDVGVRFEHLQLGNPGTDRP